MKRLLLIAVAVPCLSFGQRVPENALYVGRSNADKAEYHLRVDRIQKLPQGHSVWVHQVLPTAKPLEFGPKKGQTYNYSISNWIISCGSSATAIAQTAFYRTGGALVTSENYGDGPLERAIPDSVADGVLDTACQHLGIPR